MVNSASDSVTPVNLVTRRADKPIRVGADPQAIALTPNGRMAYVVNSGSGTVTPIATGTRRPGTAIPVGSDPQQIAITPDGRTAYVTNEGSDSVTPIDLATGVAGTPIPVGSEPRGIAITPDGRTAFVLDWGGSSVTPISVASGQAGSPIRVGGYPFAIAVAPDGGAVYVASYGSDTVTRISTGTLSAWRPVRVGQAPNALAVSPDGRTVLAVNGDSDTVTPVSAAGSRRSWRSWRPAAGRGHCCPGWLLADGCRDHRVRADSVRRQHDFRNADAGLADVRASRKAGVGRCLLLPDRDCAGPIRVYRRCCGLLRRTSDAGQHQFPARAQEHRRGRLPGCGGDCALVLGLGGTDRKIGDLSWACGSAGGAGSWPAGEWP